MWCRVPPGITFAETINVYFNVGQSEIYAVAGMAQFEKIPPKAQLEIF